LIQQYRKSDEGYLVVKLSFNKKNDFLKKIALINYVPAIAVKREERALFGIIGRKAFVGC